MAESHVISALRKKRAEVSGYIHDLEKKVRHLRAVLAHVDATIRLFEPDADPNAIPPRRTYKRSRYFSAGELPRHCLDLLRESGKPMSALELTDAVMKAKGLSTDNMDLRRKVGDSVLAVLRSYQSRGALIKTGVSQDARWAIKERSE